MVFRKAFEMRQNLICSDTEKILVIKGIVTQATWDEEVLVTWK